MKNLYIALILMIGLSLSAQSQNRATITLQSLLTEGKATPAQVEQLIKEGADLTYKSTDLGWKRGLTPLLIAAAWGRLDLIKVMVQHGANLYEKVEEDNTVEWDQQKHKNCNAFHLALYYENDTKFEILDYLLQKGFDINEYCYGGQTPIMYAIMSKYTTIETIKYLVNHGADVKKLRESTSEGVFSYLASTGETKPNRAEMAEYLLSHGAPLSIGENYDDWTILHQIIYFNLNDLLEPFLKSGKLNANEQTNARLENEYGLRIIPNSYLNFAVLSGNLQAAETLIRYGASKNVKTSDNETALEIAKRLNNPSMINLLQTGTLLAKDKAWNELISGAEYANVEFYHNSDVKPFSAKRLSGGTVDQNTYKGKVVLLNMWATWCGYCIQEFPSMQKLTEMFPSSKFVIIAASQDQAGLDAKVQNFITNHPYKFDWLYDPVNGNLSNYPTALPGTFLLDKEGRIVAEMVGMREWTDEKYVKLIQAVIDK